MSTNNFSSNPEFSAVFRHGVPEAAKKPRYFSKGKNICDRLIGLGKEGYCEAVIPFAPGRGTKKKRAFVSAFRTGVTTQAKKRGVGMKCIQQMAKDHFHVTIVHVSDLSD